MMEQLPNRVYPQGIRLKLSEMAEAFAKGGKLLPSQTYEIKNSVGEGDLLAVECPGRANWPWHWVRYPQVRRCGPTPPCSLSSETDSVFRRR
jgi:hypothetical protein